MAASRLFLGNLPWALSNVELEQNLRDRGVDFVSASVVFDRSSGRSRGFGFVELREGSDPGDAKIKLEGAVFGGRELHVEDAVTPKAAEMSDRGAVRRSGGDRRGGGRRGGRSGRGDRRGWDDQWRD